jgi:hypothetical protein
MRLWTSLGIVMISTWIGGAALADSDDGDRCRRIRAEIDLTNGTIEGNFGLDGTVAFVGDSSGTAPPTAPGGSSVFSGILTVTTARGNLILRETGMFSSRTGNPGGPVLAAWGDALSGTQRFTGVTGELFFSGRRVGSIFLVDVSGQLCQPPS